MRKLTAQLLYFAAIVGTVVACGGGEPEPQYAGDGVNTQANHSACDASPADMLALVNAARSVGRVCGGVHFPPAPPLALSGSLNQAAAAWSADMARTNAPAGHIDSMGRDQQDRADASGYRGAVGENSSAGQSSAANAVQRFTESSGHCANLMRRDYRDFGAACTKTDAGWQTYWVHSFGIPA